MGFKIKRESDDDDSSRTGTYETPSDLDEDDFEAVREHERYVKEREK